MTTTENTGVDHTEAPREGRLPAEALVIIGTLAGSTAGGLHLLTLQVRPPVSLSMQVQAACSSVGVFMALCALLGVAWAPAMDAAMVLWCHAAAFSHVVVRPVPRRAVRRARLTVTRLECLRVSTLVPAARRARRVVRGDRRVS